MHYTKWEREWTESDGISAPYIYNKPNSIFMLLLLSSFFLCFTFHTSAVAISTHFPSCRKQHIQRRARGFYSLGKAWERETLRVSRETWNMYRIHTWNERTVASSHIPILKMVRNMADVWWYLWLNLSLPHGETLKHGWIIE